MEVKIKASNLLQDEIDEIMANPAGFLVKQLTNAKLLGPLSGGMNGALLLVPDIADLNARKERVISFVDFMQRINEPEEKLRILGDFSHQYGALIIAAKEPEYYDLINEF